MELKETKAIMIFEGEKPQVSTQLQITENGTVKPVENNMSMMIGYRIPDEHVYEDNEILVLVENVVFESSMPEKEQRPPWISQPPECELVFETGKNVPTSVICLHFEHNSRGEKRFVGSQTGKITFG